MNLNLFSLPNKREWKYIWIYFVSQINGSENKLKSRDVGESRYGDGGGRYVEQ